MTLHMRTAGDTSMLGIHWAWQCRRIVIAFMLLFHVSVQSVDTSDIKTNYYLSKLMSKYGDGNGMFFEGFEHLLHGLGLGGRIVFDHDMRCHIYDDTFVLLHSHHNHSVLISGPLTENCSKRMLQGHGGHKHIPGHGNIHERHEHTHDHDHVIYEPTYGHKHKTHEHKTDHNHEHGHGSHEHTHGHDHGSHKQTHGNKRKQNTDHYHSGQNHKHSHEYRRTPRNHTRSEHKLRGKDHKQDTTTGSPKTNQTDVHKQKTSESQQKSKRNRGSGYAYHPRRGSSKLKTKKDVDNTNHTDVSSTTSSSQSPAKTSVTSTELTHSHVKDKQDDKDVAIGDTHNEATARTSENSDIKERSHSIEKRYAVFEEKCLSPGDLLGLINMDVSTTISKEMFKELCPTLIYQIDADACHQHHTMPDDHASDNHDHGHSRAELGSSNATLGLNDVPAKVWGYSSLAVMIISLVGLLGVAVIPIMQKMFYQQLLQFLVALAVGALSGDALLHLLPHALSGGHGEETGSHAHGEEGQSHDNSSIFKCLCGLMGIYVFFFMERCLVILSAFRKMRKKNETSKPSTGTDTIMSITDADDEQMMQLNKPPLEYHNEKDPDTKHGHGHSHSMDGAPGSVAAVAWMIIMGDGIHNFCDGLAIGAAFVNSITSGFSTSIAVFCHELPHEIGDFAMLLKAGMTIKQAIFYNCVSSILCFLGMLVGIAVGNMAGASLWVFVVVAGMFLYIALVDMLPELTSGPVDNTKDALIELLLQLIGMLIGAGIMLAIALYEEDLQTILD